MDNYSLLLYAKKGRTISFRKTGYDQFEISMSDVYNKKFKQTLPENHMHKIAEVLDFLDSKFDVVGSVKLEVAFPSNPLPCQNLWKRYGVATVEEAQALKDEEILSVPGAGKVFLQRLRQLRK